MKIRDAWQAYNVQLDELRERRKSLSSLLKEEENRGEPSVDRVEISRELKQADAQYEAVFQGRESIIAMNAAIANGEAAKQQGEAMAKAAQDIARIMEVYRRIASGAKVPSEDEQKLMDYSYELYSAAKTAAMIAKKNDEEYDSLWDGEDEDSGEQKDPMEIAAETEIAVAAPEDVAAAAISETAVE